MKGHKMKHTFVMLFLLAVVLASCDNGSDAPLDTVEQQVTSIPVFLQQRKAASGIELNDDSDTDEENNDEFFIINSFEEGQETTDGHGSLLYFSQLTSSSSQYFSDLDADASPYLYIYEYKKNENAKWDNDQYNFSLLKEYTDGQNTYSGRKALDWSTVKDVGSVGNAFSFYALHFPIDNKVRFNVEENQREKDNFMKSDIMGAYHATSSLYTRLRFRLFHLMVYLRVTLYVPVHKSESEQNKIEPSGFSDDALQGAYVLNAVTDFGIEWYANRSSDTEPPLTQAKGVGKNKNIAMYRHPSSKAEITHVKVSDYYNKNNVLSTACSCSHDGDDNSCPICGCKQDSDNKCTSCGCDEVYVYNFSVLFPAQTFKDNFLCFALKPFSTSGETTDDSLGELRYYYFSATNLIGDATNNYSLTQGTLQHLYLYLPRTADEAILVTAKILPWNNADTEMTVTQETE